MSDTTSGLKGICKKKRSEKVIKNFLGRDVRNIYKRKIIKVH